MIKALPAKTLQVLMNLWPPFRGAGIRVKYIAKDYREILVEMKLRWLNRNYVGTHYGGSLYSMIDPFYMLMRIHNMGPKYVVWDKSAQIDFITPGKDTVTAHFRLSEANIDRIRQDTGQCDKYIAEFPIAIKNAQGEIVANALKYVYIRLKPRACDLDEPRATEP